MIDQNVIDNLATRIDLADMKLLAIGIAVRPYSVGQHIEVSAVMDEVRTTFGDQTAYCSHSNRQQQFLEVTAFVTDYIRLLNRR